jgi:hypothetical protein
MRSLQKCAAIAFAALSFTSFDVAAAIDPAAPVVLLRTSCNDGAGGTLNNCFDNSGDLLGWIFGIRNPSATLPLLVEIGPGTFEGMGCTGPNRGHITFRGSGRDNTVLTSPYGFTGENCDALAFEDMTISGTLIGVAWFKGGSSNWANVEIRGVYRAWYDAIDNTGQKCTNEQGTHKFFSSTIRLDVPNGIGGDVHAIFNKCGKNWLWGSEIVAEGMTGLPLGILSLGAGNETHVYGGNIRVMPDASAPIGTLIAIRSGNSAQVHVHGTGIDVIANNASTVTALDAYSSGEIHASETAYVLKAGTGGLVNRISNGNGHIHAPYQWQHVPDPITVPNFTSKDGADQATVMVDGYPHSAIYSTKCATDTGNTAKWYDTVDKICRSQ